MAGHAEEHFQTLRHRQDEGWVGHIHLPLFAALHFGEVKGNLAPPSGATVAELRQEKFAARRREELAAGRFQLIVDDPDEEGPTKAQRQAYDLLIEREAEVLEAVLVWVFETYRDRGYWTLEGFVRGGPAVETLDELRACMRLESVAIDREDAVGQAARTTFYFSSSLDEEHGVEVPTLGTKVDDDDSEQIDPRSGLPLLKFPWTLPDSLDLSAIEPSTDGHRFVEFRYGGKWSGIFVLDPSLKCVGMVSTGAPRSLADPNDIEDVRAVSRWQRWRSSQHWQRRVLALVAALNLLVALPCLAFGWLYEPRLFWVCLALGAAAHGAYFVFRCSGERMFGLATGYMTLAVGGLVYAYRGANFGTVEHTEAVSDVFGLILWWGTCAITAIASLMLGTALITLRKDIVRDGWAGMLFVLPGIICVAVLALALQATAAGRWSSLHLLWITPTTLIGSLVVFVITPVFLPDAKEEAAACPECGQLLATAAAKQCLHCGADWH